jgi:F0F1-type ATP synthase membrane subunit b/b'
MQVCGTSSASCVRRRRGTCARVAAICATALSVLLAVAGPAAAATATTNPKPKPQSLWRAYPLDDAHRPGVTHPSTRTSATQPKRQGSSGSDTGWLVAAALIAAAAAAALAGLVLRLRGTVPAIPGRTAAFFSGTAFRPRLPQGGAIMKSSRRKLWSRDAGDSEQPPKREEARPMPARSEQAPRASLTERVQAATGAPVEPEVDSATADVTADLADVGVEVGTVLKSAQEAAARIRRQAREEATKIRDEAKAAAGAELAEARRLADADRSEGARLRAEAEADAEAARAEAETFAQELRTNAEHEADTMLEEARKRAARVDAEIEQRLRHVESEAHRRRDTLQAESKLYEKRLEKMLGVFNGMTTQLEQLLGVQSSERQADAGEDGKADGETLEAALQPDAAAGTRD